MRWAFPEPTRTPPPPPTTPGTAPPACNGPPAVKRFFAGAACRGRPLSTRPRRRTPSPPLSPRRGGQPYCHQVRRSQWPWWGRRGGPTSDRPAALARLPREHRPPRQRPTPAYPSPRVRPQRPETSPACHRDRVAAVSAQMAKRSCAVPTWELEATPTAVAKKGAARAPPLPHMCRPRAPLTRPSSLPTASVGPAADACSTALVTARRQQRCAFGGGYPRRRPRAAAKAPIHPDFW